MFFVSQIKKYKLTKYKLKDILMKCWIYSYGLDWFGYVLWHINHCRLFNAKSISIYTSSFISDNSV